MTPAVIIQFKQLLGSHIRSTYSISFLRTVSSERGEAFQVQTKGGRHGAQITFAPDAIVALRAALDAYDALNAEDAK